MDAIWTELEKKISNVMIDPSVFMLEEHLNAVKGIPKSRAHYSEAFADFINRGEGVDKIVREFTYTNPKKTQKKPSAGALSNIDDVKSMIESSGLTRYTYKTNLDRENEIKELEKAQKVHGALHGRKNSQRLIDEGVKEIVFDEFGFLREHSGILSANRIFLHQIDRILGVPGTILDFTGKFKVHKKRILNKVGIDNERNKSLKWILAIVISAELFHVIAPPLVNSGEAAVAIVALDP